MRDYLSRAVRASLGLALFGFGVYLSIQANIGLAPWDCLCMGIARHVPLTYGTISICISVVILLCDLLLGERVGLGTLIDAVLVGACVDLFTALRLLPVLHDPWLGVAVMLVGLCIMAYGQYVYMSAALCCGPRDTLLVALGKRMRRVSIGVVNILILIVVLIAGALLGGPIGIGTILSTFGVGLMMNLVFRLVRFEPRDVRHDDLLAMTKKLAHGK